MDAENLPDAEAVVAGDVDLADPELLEQLAAHPMDCVDTEFPHHARTVEGPDGTPRPAERHPVFYGCFDWHSAVHSHWCLVRQLRLVDGHPREAEIVESFEGRLTAENVEREAEFLRENRSFENPYGWAWFLRLVAELHLWADGRGDDRAGAWRDVLEPLEETVVTLVEEEFLTRPRPFRVGTHGNSAVALGEMLDYARVVEDGDLASAVEETAREFYLEDREYPVEYEPLGWDFLSPALVEADLMRRVLEPGAFEAWLEGFLPDVRTAPYDRVLDPTPVDDDPEEGLELHFVGLNLSKAWCLRGVASTLEDHRLREPLERSAERHVAHSLQLAFTDDYAGAHWLGSFVLYLCTLDDGGIAPR